MKKENLSVLAYANGFSFWHYRHFGEIEQVVEDTQFFVPVSHLLKQGDAMLINAGKSFDHTSLCYVSRVSGEGVRLAFIK